MTALPSPRSSARPHLRLVIEPTQDRQQAWYAQADRDLRQFLLSRGHQLSDPSLANWVVEQCAELAWECVSPDAPGQIVEWSALRVHDLWLRLGNLHRFFPQPRLVVAFYETLQLFLPWLCSQGRLERVHCLSMLDQLEHVRSPMLERARQTLALRLR